MPGGEDAVFAAERELLERHGHTVLVYERSNEEAAHGLPKALLPLPESRRRLWEELAQAHEEACDVRRYFVLLDTGDREAAAAMERYDAAFRRLCVERGALAEAQLPFLLGQPLRDLPRDGA